ncbi:MAG TPA: FHA domain-containing serine/threonine-protein kinase [Planctomycetota bacterium]|nr:FHA domain-containing serine/threonine-protein kinase [Planctomycetota bacterium]
MRVELRFVKGPRAGQSFPLDDNVAVIIGRGVETNFRIQDPSISRRHCQISNGPQGILIADLGSSNGTYVNGQRIGTWTPLKPNDQVVLGNNEFLIAPPPAPPPQRMGSQPAAVCSNCNRPVTAQDLQQGRVRQDTNGRLICSDCLKQFDFEPNLIDGYVIQKKLGQGAFGAVYKATQTATGIIVALKTIKPQLVSNENDVKRFYREAETGGKLKHPSICGVYDAGECRGNHYIAMEYIEGRELTKYIEQYGRLDVGYSLKITIQIASALGHAFQQGIVHRDIKPDNIMISIDPQTRGPMAKLVDFGLAKSFTSSGQSGLTAPGEGMGTLAYMPPEQLDNALKADQRSDIYSLGASLYHMLAGKRPFEEKTTRSFILKILNQMPPPLRVLNPTVPQEVQQIVEKSMAKAPEDRYQTPQDFEKELVAIFNKLAARYAAQQSKG